MFFSKPCFVFPFPLRNKCIPRYTKTFMQALTKRQKKERMNTHTQLNHPEEGYRKYLSSQSKENKRLNPYLPTNFPFP